MTQPRDSSASFPKREPITNPQAQVVLSSFRYRTNPDNELQKLVPTASSLVEKLIKQEDCASLVMQLNDFADAPKTEQILDLNTALVNKKNRLDQPDVNNPDIRAFILCIQQFARIEQEKLASSSQSL